MKSVPASADELEAVIDAAVNKRRNGRTGKLPLAWLDMSNWDNEPVPERKWAIRDRVPLNQAGLFSGEGGAGKSIIELTKDVAHVAGKDWFGSCRKTAPLSMSARKMKQMNCTGGSLHRRSLRPTFKDLIDGGLHVLCKLGEDATLCAVGKSGRVETTDFYRQLYEAAGDLKPKNISIDTCPAPSPEMRLTVCRFMPSPCNAGLGNGRRRFCHRPQPSELAGHCIRIGHFRFDRMARRVSLPAISEGRKTERR